MSFTDYLDVNIAFRTSVPTSGTVVCSSSRYKLTTEIDIIGILCTHRTKVQKKYCYSTLRNTIFHLAMILSE